MASSLPHQLLKFIDQLKPVLCLSLSRIQFAYQQFLRYKSRDEYLEYSVVSTKNLGKYFPTSLEAVNVVVSRIAVKNDTGELVVAILDLLTILCVMSVSSVADKAKMLFEWYNVSSNGLLTEFEHTKLILRFSHTARKMKLIGALELTENDANFIALDARVYNAEEKRLRFKPGLYLIDFQHWIETNTECATIFKAMEVMKRLILALKHIDLRATGVMRMMSDKAATEATATSVFPLQHVPRDSYAAAYCTFKDDCSLGFAILMHEPCLSITSTGNWDDQSIYVKIEKIVARQHSLALERRTAIQSNDGAQQMCCQQYYTVVSCRCISTNSPEYMLSVKRNQLLLACVALSDLEADTHYMITLYTRQWQCRPMQLRTKAACKVHHNVLDQSVGVKESTSRSVLCILPSNNTGASEQAMTQVELKLLERSVGNNNASNSDDDDGAIVIDTSPLVHFDDIFEHARTTVAQDELNDHQLNFNLVSSTVLQAEQYLVFTLAQNLNKLHNESRFSTSKVANQLNHSLQRQLIHCNCSNPWNNIAQHFSGVSTNALFYVSALSVDATASDEGSAGNRTLKRMNAELVDLYTEYARFFMPLKPVLKCNYTRVIFIANKLHGDRSSVGNQKNMVGASHYTAEEFIAFLNNEITMDAMRRNQLEHLVVLMESPLDLMEPQSEWANLSADSTAFDARAKANVSLAQYLKVKGLQSHMETLPISNLSILQKSTTADDSNNNKNNVNDDKKSQLVGRQEVLYGEYTDISKLKAQQQQREADYERNRAAKELEEIRAKKHASISFDMAFFIVIRTLFNWMRGSASTGLSCSHGYSADACADNANESSSSPTVLSRKVTILSSAWEGGVNFEITDSGASHGTGGGKSGAIIQHYCLLPTRTAEEAAATKTRIAAKSSTATNKEAKKRPHRDAFADLNSLDIANRLRYDDDGLALPHHERAHAARKPLLEFNDTVIERIDCSIPKECTYKLFPASKLRSIIINTERTTIDNNTEAEHPPPSLTVTIQTVNIEKSNSTQTVDYTVATILDAPKILRVTNAEVLVSVEATGGGLLLATLYELPMTVRYDDTKSLLATERHKLRKVAEITKLCIVGHVIYQQSKPDARHEDVSSRSLLFRFQELVPHCNYCVTVESAQQSANRDYRAAPLFVQFKTMAISSSASNSAVLAPVFASDYLKASERIRKVSKLIEIFRAPPSMVFFVHCGGNDVDAAVKTVRLMNDLQRLNEVQSSDVHALSRLANVVHTVSSHASTVERHYPHANFESGRRNTYRATDAMQAIEQHCSMHSTDELVRVAVEHLVRQSLLTTQDNLHFGRDIAGEHRKSIENKFFASNDQYLRNSVHVSTHSVFCYVTMSNDSSECLEQVCKVVDDQIRYMSNIRYLVVFASQPLVRYLRRNDADTDWIVDSMIKKALPLCARLFGLLLHWKCEKEYRDCKIIGMADVPAVKCAIIKLNDAFNGVQQESSLAQPSLFVNSSRGDISAKESIHAENPKSGLSLANRIDLHIETGAPVNDATRMDDMSRTINTISAYDFYPENQRVAIKQGVTFEHLILPIFYTPPQQQPQPPPVISQPPSKVQETVQPSASASFAQEDSVTASHSNVLTAEPSQASAMVPVENTATMLFPSGACQLNNLIEYEMVEDLSNIAEHYFVNQLLPRVDLYSGNSLFEPRDPIVYRIELMFPTYHFLQNKRRKKRQRKPGKKKQKHVVRMSKQDISTALQLEEQQARLAKRQNTKSANHAIQIRTILQEVDLLEILLGPLVGTVTSTTAKILFEFNMDAEHVLCYLKPKYSTSKPPRLTLNDDKAEVKASKPLEVVARGTSGVKAFTVVQFSFDGLTPGTIYEIFLPDFLVQHRALGRFKTVELFSSFAEIAITGIDCMQNNAVMDLLAEELRSQQSPQLMEIGLLANPAFEDDPEDELLEQQNAMDAIDLQPSILRTDSLASYSADESQSLLSAGMRLYSEKKTMWKLLKKHLCQPGLQTAATFHLGAQSMLVLYMNDIVHALLEHANRIQLPLNESSALGVWYYRQFEEIIKDTFRIFFSMPSVRDVFSLSSNIPIFNSSYLLPLSRMSTATVEALSDEESNNAILLQVIRNVFDEQLQNYVYSLYNFDPNVDTHHYRVWRHNSLAVATLDIAAGRKKLKGDKKTAAQQKNDEDDEMIAEEAESKAEKSVYSLGFISKSQWKSLRSLGIDKTITQIIILTEQPILSLQSINDDYAPPSEPLKRGEILRWEPTRHDLEVFCKYWIDWLALYPRNEISTSRNITLVTTSNINFSTVIEDMRTGLKIQQFCIGSSSDAEKYGNEAISHRMKYDEYVLSGKFGTIKYEHTLGGKEFYQFESARTAKLQQHLLKQAVESDIASKSQVGVGYDEIMKEKPSFAILKTWFDSYQALNIWSTVSHAPKDIGDAILLIGPVIGAPRTVLRDDVMYFYAPVLVEVDKAATLTVVAINAFTEEAITISCELLPKKPFVFELGPMDVEARYNVRITKGLKHPFYHSTFTVNTHVSDIETNVVVLNCEEISGMNSSNFLLDIMRRVDIPFNGITAVVHTNFQPNTEPLLMGMVDNPLLIECMEEFVVTKKLSPLFREELGRVMEVLRGHIRSFLSKPTYREVLKRCFNVMMQNVHPIDIDLDEKVRANGVETRQIKLKRLLKLMVARIHQEYFDQLAAPNINVFRAAVLGDLPVAEESDSEDEAEVEAQLLEEAMKRVQRQTVMGRMSRRERERLDEQRKVVKEEDVENEEEEPALSPIKMIKMNTPVGMRMDPQRLFKRALKEDLEIQAVNATIPVRLKWSNPSRDDIESVFIQWIQEFTPAPAKFRTWLSPNGKVSVEQLRSISENTLATVCEHVQDSPIESGVRILIFNDLPDGTAVDELLNKESGIAFKVEKEILDWIDTFTDREVCLVCPSNKYGSKKVELKNTVFETALSVHMLDSVYRNNEFERLSMQMEKDKDSRATKVKKPAVAAMTKRAQQKRQEEERQRQLEVQKEVQEMATQFVPDGYLLVQSQSTSIESVDEVTDDFCLTKPVIIGSIMGDETERMRIFEDILNGVPTPYDLIQMPEWIAKFCPATDAIFVQDEVWLYMREAEKTRVLIDLIESNKMIEPIMHVYEESQLSELSRPDDLREVDMELEGVVDLFLKEITERLWFEVVPANIRENAFDLSDDFVRSYCYSRAMNDIAILSSPNKFAYAFQYALMLSIAFRTAYQISHLEAFQYVLNKPDDAIAIVDATLMESGVARTPKEISRRVTKRSFIAADGGIKADSFDQYLLHDNSAVARKSTISVPTAPKRMPSKAISMKNLGGRKTSAAIESKISEFVATSFKKRERILEEERLKAEKIAEEERLVREREAEERRVEEEKLKKEQAAEERRARRFGKKKTKEEKEEEAKLAAETAEEEKRLQEEREKDAGPRMSIFEASRIEAMEKLKQIKQEEAQKRLEQANDPRAKALATMEVAPPTLIRNQGRKPPNVAGGAKKDVEVPIEEEELSMDDALQEQSDAESDMEELVTEIRQLEAEERAREEAEEAENDDDDGDDDDSDARAAQEAADAVAAAAQQEQDAEEEEIQQQLQKKGEQYMKKTDSELDFNDAPEMQLKELINSRDKTTLEVFERTLNNILEAEFMDAFELQVHDLNLEFELLQKLKLPKEERLYDSKAYMVRLMKERIENKRLIGRKTKFTIVYKKQ